METVRRQWAKDGRSGVMDTVRVLIGKSDIVEAVLGDGVRVPAESELVDYLVDVNTSDRGFLRVQVVGPWLDLYGGQATAPAAGTQA
jgi:hypothetical protein